ncbi:transposable element Tcb1 transposase [Trichonephila clavipes]|nr:transposable element Tcb1 transposase [Trichonephila clavipes]
MDIKDCSIFKGGYTIFVRNSSAWVVVVAVNDLVTLVHSLEAGGWGCEQLKHLGSRRQSVEECLTDAHLDRTPNRNLLTDLGSPPVPTRAFCIAKGDLEDISVFGRQINKNLRIYAWPNYWKDRRRVKITDVAKKFDIAHSVVSRLWKSFKTTGMCSRRHGGGRVRSTTPAEDRYIVLSAKRNRRTTTQQVSNQFLAASGKQISRKTVARRLRGGGLYARRPFVCVPWTRQHRTAHLQWCREHLNWTEQDWACVLFSDESRISLSSDCRRQLIWRESGTAYRPENIQEKDRYPTCSIMVWAGIMINGRTRLQVVANGTMTG